ncbi:O-antigen ligase family protein [Frederiksenia canicola]
MAIWFNCVFGFLFLLSGNFFIYDFDADFLKKFVQLISSLYVCFFILFNRRIVVIKSSVLFYIFLGLIVLLICTFNSHNFFYAFKKIDSIIVCSSLSCLFFSILLTKYTAISIVNAIKNIALFVLAVTVVYKIKFGFFERDVKFFLNGPNVFGWLYGFYFLLTLYFSKVQHKYKNTLVLIIFLLSVFWSESKGALISLSVSVLFLFFLLYFKDRVRLYISLRQVLSILFFLFIVVFFMSLFYSLEESRLYAITRIFSQEMQESDYGSVGIRVGMYIVSFELFVQNYILGVGLGNFPLYSGYPDIDYPHNIPLELLAETGLFGFSLFFIYFLLILFKKDKYVIFLIFFFYFFVACLFSGDLGYYRYAMLFLLLGLNLSKSF